MTAFRAAAARGTLPVDNVVEAMPPLPAPIVLVTMVSYLAKPAQADAPKGRWMLLWVGVGSQAVGG